MAGNIHIKKINKPSGKESQAKGTDGNARAKYDWVHIKETYFQSYIQKSAGAVPMTLVALAKKFDVDYDYLRNRSSRQKWPEQLAERLKLFDQEVASRLAATRSAVTEQLQEEFVGNELEIRTRHAKVARGMQAKAVQKLINVKADELKPSEAIAMLELGMREERRAMGMSETYEKPSGEGKLHPEYKDIQQQMGDHSQVSRRAAALLKALKESEEAAGGQALLPAPDKKDELQAGDAAVDITPKKGEVDEQKQAA